MKKYALLASATLVLAFLIGRVHGHGDVQPQPVDIGNLELLGDEWRVTNPYVGNEEAIEIGASAYNQNCARCHGLQAISGGIAPDLRELPSDADGDEWYAMRVQNGVVRNGITYMPAFGELLGQEALWAIRAWLLTVAEDA